MADSDHNAMTAQYDQLIDRKLLIQLVKERPVLWDKYCLTYRNKNLKINAWREVSSLLVSNYGQLEDKYFFEKCVIKRWTRIRDSWKKTLGINKAWRDSHGAAGSRSHYKYHNKLTFLKPVIDPDNIHHIETASPASSHDETEPADEIRQIKMKTEASIEKRSKTLKPAKKRKHTNALYNPSVEEKDERNMLFLKSILPSLRLLDDDTTLEFQSGVINLVQTLKREGAAQRQFPMCFASPHSASEASTSQDPIRYPETDSD